MSARCHQVNVTAREKVMLAFYRSVDENRRLAIDGVLYDGWSTREAAIRFRAEGRTLRIGTLTVSHIAPFADASRKLEAGELDAQRITTK